MGTMRSACQVLVVALSAIAAGASASSNEEVARPTPYQPMAWNGGYREDALGNGMWQVEVKGNAYTTGGTVLSYAYKRANEICPAGYDIVDRTGGAASTTYSSSRAGGARFDNSMYASGTTETTTESKPNVTLIVRCKAAQSAAPGETGAR